MNRTLTGLHSKSGSIARIEKCREIRAAAAAGRRRSDNSVDICDRYDNQRTASTRPAAARLGEPRASIAGSRISRDTRRPTLTARSVSNI